MVNSVLYEISPTSVFSEEDESELLSAAEEVQSRLEDWLMFHDLIGTKYFWQKPEDFIPDPIVLKYGPFSDPKCLNINILAKVRTDRAVVSLRDEGINMELFKLNHHFGESRYNTNYLITINYTSTSNQR